MSAIAATIDVSKKSKNMLRSTLTRQISSLNKVTGSLSRSVGLRSISVTAVTRSSELKEVIAREIEHEKETGFDTKTPQNLTESLSSLPFKLVEKNGSVECMLERVMGKEKISIAFRVVPEDSTSEFDDEDNDEALDGELDAEAAEHEDDEQMSSEFSIPVTISVEKTGSDQVLKVHGAIVDYEFNCDDVELVNKNASEKDLETAYTGPKYEDLDFSFMDAFEEWLEQRGINEDVSAFITDYSVWKERKEYVDWMENLKKFVQ